MECGPKEHVTPLRNWRAATFGPDRRTAAPGGSPGKSGVCRLAVGTWLSWAGCDPSSFIASQALVDSIHKPRSALMASQFSSSSHAAVVSPEDTGSLEEEDEAGRGLVWVGIFE